jgi:HlyD family secretion protein
MKRTCLQTITGTDENKSCDTDSYRHHPTTKKTNYLHVKIRLLLILLIPALMACDHRKELSDAYGNFEVEDIIISAEVTGNLLEFPIQEADKISKGQEIGLIDTIQYFLQMNQLKAQKMSVQSKTSGVNAQIATYQQQKENIQVTCDRVTKLVTSGAATQQQKDDLEGQLKLVDKQIEAAKTQITSINREEGVLGTQEALIDEQLSKCRIKSPINGVVLKKYINEGEIAIAGKALLKIADLSVLELRCYITGDELSSVKLGQQVKVLFDTGNNQMESITGKVSWISDEAEFSPKIIQTKKERVKLVYAMKVKVENDGRLKVGMPGEVRFK